MPGEGWGNRLIDHDFESRHIAWRKGGEDTPMKAVIAHRDGTPHVVELDQPPVGQQTVAIRVSHSAMMLPRELHLLAKVPSRLKKGQDGLPLGSMCSGIVDEVGGKVEGLKAGLRVAAFGYPYVYHASHLSVPANLVLELPKKVNHEEGAFTGQGAAVVHLVRETRVALGETILIFGAGMTGVLAAQIARAAGAFPVLIDDAEQKLTRARNVGATAAFVSGDQALVREIDTLTGGEGADAALVTADAGEGAPEMAGQYLRECGRVVFGPDAAGSVPASLVAQKELVVRAVTGMGPGFGDPAWEMSGIGYPPHLVRWTLRKNMAVFLGLLAERRVQISPLISERMPMDRAATCYEKIERSNGGVIGAVLTV